MTVDLSNYVDVASRLREFRDKHPEGSLQPANLEKPYEIVGNPDEGRFLVYVAAAYRTPDDARPGIGVAWEPFPGKTAFTKDSELQNAETSAWGRAIVAALAADTTRGVASQEEVRNRQDGDAPPARQAGGPRPATDKQRGAIERLVSDTGELPVIDGETCWPLPDDLTMKQASGVIDALKATAKEPKAERTSDMREYAG